MDLGLMLSEWLGPGRLPGQSKQSGKLDYPNYPYQQLGEHTDG